MAKTSDVLIIGGGILGTSLAYHLARKGCTSVVLLEKGELAQGSTGKSAAIVRSKHRLLLAYYISPEAAPWPHCRRTTVRRGRLFAYPTPPVSSATM